MVKKSKKSFYIKQDKEKIKMKKKLLRDQKEKTHQDNDQ